MKRKNRYKEIVFVVLFLAFVVSFISALGLAERIINRINEISDSLQYTDTGKSQFYYGGNKYSFNSDIESVLVMGIDSIVTSDKSTSESLQSDFVALIVMDKLEKSFSILHLNRDTMTEIRQIDSEGNEYGTFTAQLALAHTYGADGKTQCRNTVTAVENLLYNVSIDHYISFTMDTIPIVNDAIGGVSLTLNEDIPPLGDGFVKDARVTLNGEQALAFVRYRDDSPTTSNLARMVRQRQYIAALSEQYENANLDNIAETLTDVSEYIVSDYTANQLSLLMERLQEYTYEGVLTLVGEALKNGEYVEYHVDDIAVQETVINLFYEIEG